jgi:hypothetical protein
VASVTANEDLLKLREDSGDSTAELELQPAYDVIRDNTICWVIDPNSVAGASGRGYKVARPALILRAPSKENTLKRAEIQWLTATSEEPGEDHVYEEWLLYRPCFKALKNVSKCIPEHADGCQCTWGCTGAQRTFIHTGTDSFNPLFD